MSTKCPGPVTDSWTGIHKLNWKVDPWLFFKWKTKIQAKIFILNNIFTKNPLLYIWLKHQFCIFSNFLLPLSMSSMIILEYWGEFIAIEKPMQSLNFIYNAFDVTVFIYTMKTWAQKMFSMSLWLKLRLRSQQYLS